MVNGDSLPTVVCSWHLDPSGTYTMYDAKAIGSGSEGAQSSLQEVYHKGMTMAEAEEKLLIILKQVMEEKLNSTNVEVGCNCTALARRERGREGEGGGGFHSEVLKSIPPQN